MAKEIYIDLKQYFNERLFQSKDFIDAIPFSRELGHEYIYEEDIKFGELLKVDGISFLIERNNDYLDSISCENNVIDIGNIECESISFAGLCRYTDYAEPTKLVYDDTSEERAKIRFSNMNFPLTKLLVKTFDWERKRYTDASKILKTIKINDDEVNIYHYSITPKTKGKKLTNIILPDNILMFIFAITINKTSED